jgi:hypothetical protein
VPFVPVNARVICLFPLPHVLPLAIVYKALEVEVLADKSTIFSSVPQLCGRVHSTKKRINADLSKFIFFMVVVVTKSVSFG